MKKGLIALGVILLVGFLIVGSFVGRYNRFVVANEQIDGAWAQVENVLQRRGDLIPNLVSTVQGFAEQEREIFIEVANARGRLAGAVSPAEAGAANAGLTGALGRYWPFLRIIHSFAQMKTSCGYRTNLLGRRTVSQSNGVGTMILSAHIIQPFCSFQTISWPDFLDLTVGNILRLMRPRSRCQRCNSDYPDRFNEQVGGPAGVRRPVTESIVGSL